MMFVVQCYGLPPADAEAPLLVKAVLSGNQQTTLVVDLGPSTEPVTSKTALVTVEGAQQQAQLSPVMSDRLAVAFVIDSSAAGAASLPAWLSAAARFVLEAPSGTQAAAVADTSPPTLISPPQREPADTVRALSGLRAGGQRSTSDALTMAKDQFADSPAGNRVVVLYTSAVDAGGEHSSALGTRFLQAGTILIVVGGAGDSPYWSDAGPRTGGFFAPAGTSVVAPALDQMARTLRHRYLVQFPTPQTLPARVSVRVDTGKLVLAGDAVIPAESRGRPGPASRFPAEVALVTLAGCLVVFLAVVLIVRRRPARLGGVHRSGGPFFHRLVSHRLVVQRLGGAFSLRRVGEFTHPPGPSHRVGKVRSGDVTRQASTVVRERAPLPPAAVWGHASVPGAAVPGGAVDDTVARGRASVPGAVAQGRASVPGTGRPPSSGTGQHLTDDP